MESPQSSTAKRAAGVWEVDAPDGYVGLIVTNSSGRMVLRLEIWRPWYSTAWVDRLKKFLAFWDRRGISIMR